MPARPAAVTAEAVSTYAAALAQTEAAVRRQPDQRSGCSRQGGQRDAQAQRPQPPACDQASTGLAAIAWLTASSCSSPRPWTRSSPRSPGPAGRPPVQARAGEAAQEQIQQAAGLDTAIKAGKARLSAVDALRALLADGKFLQYLTDRRTLALLGAASDIFGRLSGGEFGFAE